MPIPSAAVIFIIPTLPTSLGCRVCWNCLGFPQIFKSRIRGPAAVDSRSYKFSRSRCRCRCHSHSHSHCIDVVASRCQPAALHLLLRPASRGLCAKPCCSHSTGTAGAADRSPRLAVGRTVILLHPPLSLVGVSTGIKRGVSSKWQSRQWLPTPVPRFSSSGPPKGNPR